MSRYRLRYLVLAAVAASGLGLAIAIAKVPRGGGPLPQVSTAPMALQGFRHTLYDGDHLRLRVSGDSATISNTRLFGPFSLGFVYSLVARNVTVETFPGADATPTRAAQMASLDRLSDLVSQPWGGVQVGHAELDHLRVIEHRAGAVKLILQAAFCQAGVGVGRVVCNDGSIDTNGSEVSFGTLSYDGKTLRMSPSSAARVDQRLNER